MLSYKAWRVVSLILLLAALGAGLLQPGGVRAMRLWPLGGGESQPLSLPSGQTDPLAKIEPALQQQLAASGRTDFFIWLTAKADLSPAYRLKTKQEKGQFVFETLKKMAESSQQALRQELDKQQLRYKSFYIANKILVYGGNQSLALTLASRPDVARITANRTYQLEKPKPSPNPIRVANVESNLTFIKADEVWATGITGQGTVLAGNDTGLSWDHPALIDHYRGWDGVTADHNYNWWDATGSFLTVPSDVYGHGTHTTGTMVGDDGGNNRIGVAPGAKTIHCKNMTDDGNGTDASFTECFQWDLAPWDLSGANPRPDLAPDAINNSWGYPGGSAPQFEAEITALQAAGILVEVSAGNEGELGCGTLRSPGDYLQALTTGSVDHASGSLPGLLTGFSSRGPSGLFPNDTFPDVMAPGENIRSSLPGNSYEPWSGTSMAGPHTTALVGLMWEANPALRGMVEETVAMMQRTAVPLVGQPGSNCGGDYDLGPNNDWGFGSIDALAAVQEAQDFGGIGTLAGIVTDGALPIAGATIKATLSPTQSRQTSSDEFGLYTLSVLSGTHTVRASKYGYKTTQVSNVSVLSGTTTTLNISLTPAEMYSVSGFITDSITGWPLYASLEIEGYPGEPVWSDPVTGQYSVTLAAEISYTFKVNAWSAGYQTASREVGPLTGSQSEDFDLAADLVSCNAPGYSPTSIYFEDFENGLGNWKQSGLWNLEAEADACGAQVAPFPSSTQAAYYGLDDICTFNNGNANTGALTLAAPVKLPASGNPVLSVQSYELTECGGDCFTDNRYIELSTNGGWTWTTLGEGNLEGFWYPQIFNLTPYQGKDILLRFRFDSLDGNNNDALGWLVDNVSIFSDCQVGSGGLAVGNVYDLNRGNPVNGATISNEAGQSVVSGPTPGDPAVADGFYSLFAPAGPQVLTATMAGYGLDVQTPTILQNEVVQQDFNLPAGLLTHTPAGLEITLGLGQSGTLPFTLTNEGGLAANFEIQEINGDYLPLALPAGAEPSTPVVQMKMFSSTLSEWGKGPALANRHRLKTTPLITNTLPVVIDDPAGDAAGIDLLKVKAAPILAEMVMRLEFRPGAGPIGALGYIHLDTDQNAATGLPPASLFGLPGQDIGFDYYLNLFNLPFTIDIYDANGVYLGSVIPVYQGNALEFAVPLSILGDDEGLMDVTLVMGNASGPADWAPEGGHGSISPGVPWLSENPISGTIPSLASQGLTLTFDTGVPAVSQPGSYHAQLLVVDDTPHPLPPVPVTMTVVAPANYGKLNGTVTGLEICDTPGAPLEGANILLQSGLGISQTLITDNNGGYQLWLDEARSPLTATVSHADYLTQTTVAINVTAGVTTTVNFELRLDAPCIQVEPVELEITLSPGLTTTRALTLTNTGARPAIFNMAEEARGFEIAGLQPTRLLHQGGQVRLMKESKMTAPTVTISTAKPLASGGPDPFGYTFQDSVEPGGPVYQWIEIAPPAGGSGIELAGLNDIDDGFFWPLSLPFDFNFYGTDYTVLAVNSNGTLYFQEAFLSFGNIPIPGFTGQGVDTFIAPLWDDLIIAPGEVYYQVVDSALIIEYYQVTRLGALEPGDFQVILFANGNILFQYRDVNFGDPIYDQGASATVGIQGDPFTGLQYSFDTPALSNNLAICLAYPGQPANCAPPDVPWLAGQPESGSISPGEVEVIDVIIDTIQANQPGSYYAGLSVVTDEPVNHVHTLPVSLTVTTPASYGKLSGTVTGLEMCDTPGAPLAGANVLLQNGLGLSQTTTTNVSGTYTIWLDEAHSPLTATVSHVDYITSTTGGINLTAGTTTTRDFNLRLAAPCLQVTPGQFQLTLSLGVSKTLPLTLTNTGAGPATFDLQETDLGFFPLGVAAKNFGPKPGARRGNTTQLEQMLSKPTPPRHVASANVLLIQDYAPYGYESIQTILSNYGIPYTLINSNQIGATDFSLYRMIIIPGVQGDDYNLNFNANLAKFEAFVNAGGLMLLNFAEYFDFTSNRAIPFGSANIYEPSFENYIVEPDHPIFAGVLNPYTGSAANHNYLVDLLPDDRVLVTAGASPGGNPVMIERQRGQGLLVAGGQTFEYGWIDGWESGKILENMIVYYYFSWTNPDVPWLAGQPESGSIPAGGVQTVKVVIDASVPEVNQPGSYQAALSVVTNEPANNTHSLPVNLTITPPASFGKLQGVVTGPVSCNEPGAPLEGATLLLQSGLGLSRTLTTGSGGTYEVWLDGAHSPLTAIASYPGYLTQIVPGINITASMTTTKNITLRLNAPCPQGKVTPLASTHTGQSGAVVTHTLRITNTGLAVETFYLSTSGHNWPIVTPLNTVSGAAAIVVGPLAPNAGTNIELLVMIPAGKGNGDTDKATVTLRSPQNNAPLATAILTTVVSGQAPDRRLYLPVLSKP